MPDTVIVEIPFNLDRKDLRIDPASVGSTSDQAMSFIVDEVAWESDELERIMQAAVCLLAMKAGTFGECLDTAITWERG